MAKKPTRKERMLARQRAKARRAVRPPGAPAGGGVVVTRAGRMRRAGEWPLHECLLNPDWSENQLATVWVARRSSGGRMAAGAFLVDLGCLGVKSALGWPELTPRDFAARRRKFLGEDALEPCHPPLGARIIQAGLQYATELGFSPDPDFERVRGILGDLDPALCRQPVECGKDGKPLYVAGPRDDFEGVLRQLRQAVGPGGYHYVAPVEMLDGIDVDLLRGPEDEGESDRDDEG